MTPADVSLAVDELRIGRVIDLRGAQSSGSGPLGDGGRGVILDFFELAGGIETIVPTADGFLPGLIDGGGRAVGAVLEEVVMAEGATLIHCHTGKDRTGFVVAMILALLGVADDDIITDYERSIPAFPLMITNLSAAGMAVGPEAPEYARDAPSPAGIRELMRRLRSEWDSPEAYLLAHGVGSGLLDKTRDLLIAPPDAPPHG
jgi:protein-tyrosine phosphatase